MNSVFKFRLWGATAFLAMLALFSVAAMFLWNELMPGIFGLPALNYWQALGLLVLARILFGGINPGHFDHHRGGGGFHHMNALRDRWMNMNADERMEFLRSGRSGLNPQRDKLLEKMMGMSDGERKEFMREFTRSRREFSHLHDFFNEPPSGGDKNNKPNGGKHE